MDMNSTSPSFPASPRNSVSFSYQLERSVSPRPTTKTEVLHCDIIGEKFWTDHPEILSGKK